MEKTKEGFLICPACRGTELRRERKIGFHTRIRCRCGAQWNVGLVMLHPANDIAKQAVLNLSKKRSCR